jgi:hypothetical protein
MQEHWDSIFDTDIQPVERNGKWFYGFCWDAFEKKLCPEPPPYPSSEALWTSHSLVPLGDWCREKLAGRPASAIGITRMCWRRSSSSAVMTPKGPWRSPEGLGFDRVNAGRPSDIIVALLLRRMNAR